MARNQNGIRMIRMVKIPRRYAVRGNILDDWIFGIPHFAILVRSKWRFQKWHADQISGPKIVSLYPDSRFSDLFMSRVSLWKMRRCRWFRGIWLIPTVDPPLFRSIGWDDNVSFQSGAQKAHRWPIVYLPMDDLNLGFILVLVMKRYMTYGSQVQCRKAHILHSRIAEISPSLTPLAIQMT